MFLRSLLNSLVVAASVVALSLGLAIAAAYALGRIDFRGRSPIMFLFLAVSMFPQIALLSGLFEMIRWLGLYNTLGSLIFAYMIFTLSFNIWVLTTFMRSLPRQIEAAAREKSRTIHPRRDADMLWSLDAETQGAYTGFYCATDQLTVGRTTVLGGKRTRIERHRGDECLYVVSGVLNIHIPDAEGQAWFELNPRDGFYIPAGFDHQYFNMSHTPCEFVFGVAPDF